MTRAHDRATVVAISEFDGMHVGHRALAAAAVDLARRFGRRPAGVVLDDPARLPVLLPTDERSMQLLAAGLDPALTLAVPSGSPADVADGLVTAIDERLRPAFVVLACLPETDPGGRYPQLRPSLRRAGIEVVEVERVADDAGHEITSRRIVNAMAEGRIDDATTWLGRPPRLAGPVTLGDQRGRLLGFPTANVDAPEGRVIPAAGVYAGGVRVGARRWPAAINVGVRPTFYAAGGQLLVEAHLIGYEGDLYGQDVDIDFLARLRDEQRFDGVDALVAQLRDDVARAAEVAGPPTTA